MSNKYNKGDVLVLDGDFEVRVLDVASDNNGEEVVWWYEVEPTDEELLNTLPPRFRTREVREDKLERGE